MKYLTGFDRRQATLFPTCIDDLIPEDAEVRVIDLFVDTLPLKELGFLEKAPVEEGRPMYHPADLFKLYVYGYLNRIRTSRLLERECQRNIELLWLMKVLQPCFRTIAGFRSEHLQLITYGRKLLFSIFTDRAFHKCWQQLNYPGGRFGPIPAPEA
ncbi:MAG: transposase [Bacteroidia bacterium]|nr:transposase [Bacteroidia bacterium]MBP7772421.1 transposase [Bacteroidia bacterium]